MSWDNGILMKLWYINGQYSLIFLWDFMGIVLKNVGQKTAPQRREAATPPGRPTSTV